MLISSIKVRGYRSHEETELGIDDYTVLIGSNGCGKSAVLYALDWFVNDRTLEPRDLFSAPGEQAPEVNELQVEVTFSDLRPRDRRLLREYGRKQTVTFRKIWRITETGYETKFIGDSLQGPGFAAVRAVKSVTEKRTAYNRLREEFSTLPKIERLAKSDDIEIGLARWEESAENRHLLVAIDNTDAKHMFGFNGVNVLRECVKLVLIPAGNDLISDIGTTNKGSVLNQLIGSFLTDAGQSARNDWIEEHKTTLKKLNNSVVDSINVSTHEATSRVNSALGDLVPGARVTFSPTVEPLSPKIDANIQTTVEIDGAIADVSRQGHGVQRAVMMSILQAMALGGDSNSDDRPTLILCIEEPEVYQHPTRARAFASSLTALAAQEGRQVLLATHSPYFVRPEQYSSLRRLRLHGGRSRVTSMDENAVAKALGRPKDKVSKQVQQWLPTSFSEGFFADAVALVEGPTDQVVFEHLSERLEMSLAKRGICVLNVGGKENMPMAFEILRSSGVPVYVVFDADYAPEYTSASPLPSEIASKKTRHELATNDLLGWLPSSSREAAGTEFSFGDRSYVGPCFTAFQRDLEDELSEWDAFVDQLEACSGKLRTKHAHKYRFATKEADCTAVPDSLVRCLKSIISFTESSRQ
ncbi:hypothetical protein PSET11_01532 [Arthrobacter ulcerisalmonis]|uniref:Uncharacterized protein n=1 Tax=Arthrobacter ulcerisalmonis TaxID=2483813 RepID=A0A3P5XAF9_9MICC|nr:ATP-dependent endonuclease [Arthrobacter ulcerisalmonis]VDC25447.1 hypothetical protein PSET11_01532 [Arthrobacter ulcerisalmonis]